jgi:hypothetical protein
MPVPPDLPMEPLTSVFNMICDRLSQVEETTNRMLSFMQTEHMCKPAGRLDAGLLGLPSIPLYLESEYGEEDLNDMRDRPYLTASCVALDCKSPLQDPICTARTFEGYYNPLYRKFFPDRAQEIIEREKNDDGDIALCEDFNIKSSRGSAVCEEVEYREMQGAIDTEKFADVVEIHEDTFLLLARGQFVTLRDYIAQAVRLYEAYGHRRTCMGRLTITPCSKNLAQLIQDAKQWSWVKDDENKLLKFVDESSGRYKRAERRRMLLENIERHVVLSWSGHLVTDMFAALPL